MSRFADQFVQAFDCMEESRGACVVVFARDFALLVVNDVVVERLDSGVGVQERSSVFAVGRWKLSVTRSDRREFSSCWKRLGKKQ